MSRECLLQRATIFITVIYYMSHSHQRRDILEWFGIRLFNDTDFSRVWITKPPVLYLLFHLSSAAKVVLRQVRGVHQWARNYVQQNPWGKTRGRTKGKKKCWLNSTGSLFFIPWKMLFEYLLALTEFQVELHVTIRDLFTTDSHS